MHHALKLSQDNPKLTASQIARILGISRQRVGFLLKKYRIQKTCNNCFHSNDGFCSCRDLLDIVKNPNKCPDWSPRGE